MLSHKCPCHFLGFAISVLQFLLHSMERYPDSRHLKVCVFGLQEAIASDQSVVNIKIICCGRLDFLSKTSFAAWWHLPCSFKSRDSKCSCCRPPMILCSDVSSFDAVFSNVAVGVKKIVRFMPDVCTAEGTGTAVGGAGNEHITTIARHRAGSFEALERTFDPTIFETDHPPTNGNA